MKIEEAIRIIAGDNQINEHGYYVSFEVVDGCMLLGDLFPDVYRGEQPIPTEDQAWEMASEFAKKTFGKCVNIRVYQIGDSLFIPKYSTIPNRLIKLIDRD